MGTLNDAFHVSHLDSRFMWSAWTAVSCGPPGQPFHVVRPASRFMWSNGFSECFAHLSQSR